MDKLNKLSPETFLMGCFQSVCIGQIECTPAIFVLPNPSFGIEDVISQLKEDGSKQQINIPMNYTPRLTFPASKSHIKNFQENLSILLKY